MLFADLGAWNGEYREETSQVTEIIEVPIFGEPQVMAWAEDHLTMNHAVWVPVGGTVIADFALNPFNQPEPGVIEGIVVYRLTKRSRWSQVM